MYQFYVKKKIAGSFMAADKGNVITHEEVKKRYDSRYGDYTRERQEWLDAIDIKTIVKQAEAKRK